MKPPRAEELLYDSEASLRLVDAEVERLRKGDGASSVPPAPAVPVKELVTKLNDFEEKPAIMLLPGVLMRANSEIRALLLSLRDSRTALEHATVGRLSSTQDKLKEVSSATEVAATDMLDGLDRAQALIDDLDAVEGDADKGKEIRNTLRDEIFLVMGHLQFQDITTQQLNHAASILVEMEQRLNEVAKVIDPMAMGFSAQGVAAMLVPDVNTFDPNATTKNSKERQALADDVFKKTGTHD
jgi:chemotaxis regulatin CheY-phosphate phosphatase CheZ